MATKATPRWLKHLRIGVITGILLGITGLISGTSWLTWGFLYAPALSLTNKTFWLIVWKMLGAKDENNTSPSNNDSHSNFWEESARRDREEDDEYHHYYK